MQQSHPNSSKIVTHSNQVIPHFVNSTSQLKSAQVILIAVHGLLTATRSFLVAASNYFTTLQPAQRQQVFKRYTHTHTLNGERVC